MNFLLNERISIDNPEFVKKIFEDLPLYVDINIPFSDSSDSGALRNYLRKILNDIELNKHLPANKIELFPAIDNNLIEKEPLNIQNTDEAAELMRQTICLDYLDLNENNPRERKAVFICVPLFTYEKNINQLKARLILVSSTANDQEIIKQYYFMAFKRSLNEIKEWLKDYRLAASLTIEDMDADIFDGFEEENQMNIPHYDKYFFLQNLKKICIDDVIHILNIKNEAKENLIDVFKKQLSFKYFFSNIIEVLKNEKYIESLKENLNYFVVKDNENKIIEGNTEIDIHYRYQARVFENHLDKFLLTRIDQRFSSLEELVSDLVNYEINDFTVLQVHIKRNDTLCEIGDGFFSKYVPVNDKEKEGLEILKDQFEIFKVLHIKVKDLNDNRLKYYFQYKFDSYIREIIDSRQELFLIKEKDMFAIPLDKLFIEEDKFKEMKEKYTNKLKEKFAWDLLYYDTCCFVYVPNIIEICVSVYKKHKKSPKDLEFKRNFQTAFRFAKQTGKENEVLEKEIEELTPEEELYIKILLEEEKRIEEEARKKEKEAEKKARLKVFNFQVGAVSGLIPAIASILLLPLIGFSNLLGIILVVYTATFAIAGRLSRTKDPEEQKRIVKEKEEKRRKKEKEKINNEVSKLNGFPIKEAENAIYQTLPSNPFEQKPDRDSRRKLEKNIWESLKISLPANLFEKFRSNKNEYLDSFIELLFQRNRLLKLYFFDGNEYYIPTSSWKDTWLREGIKKEYIEDCKAVLSFYKTSNKDVQYINNILDLRLKILYFSVEHVDEVNKITKIFEDDKKIEDKSKKKLRKYLFKNKIEQGEFDLRTLI